MHSWLLTASCLLLSTLALLGFSSSDVMTLAALALGVAVVGVPHGALDPVAGRDVFKPWFGAYWLMSFFTAYLLLASFIVIGWYFLPTLTCLTFFLLSAWHFGLEEDYATLTSHGWLDQVLAVARGSLPVVGVAWFWPTHMSEILQQVMPRGEIFYAQQVVDASRTAGFVLLPLLLCDFAFACKDDVNRFVRVGCRVVSQILLVSCSPPLISFGVYFCCWHSVRGLKELFTHANVPLSKFVALLSPLSFATLILALGAFMVWTRTDSVTSSLIRTLFVGLSAIAIPHLALHALRRVTVSSADFGARKEAVLCT